VVKKDYVYTSTPRLGRSACTEPQCLYEGAFYIFIYFILIKFMSCGKEWDLTPIRKDKFH